MVALRIDQSDFAKKPYYNITLEQRRYINHQNGTREKIKELVDLVPCTIDKFQRPFDKFNVNFTETYNSLDMDSWLCLPENTTLKLRGAFSNEFFDFVKIEVSDCQDSSTSNFTWQPECASQEEIQEKLAGEGTLRVNIYMTNFVKMIFLYYYSLRLLILISQKIIYRCILTINYFLHLYYRSIQISFQIPQKLVRQADIFWEKYFLQTDQSVIPLENYEYQDIDIRANFREITEIGYAGDDRYAAFYFQRSPFTYEVTRSFQKIDDLLSYLGGFLEIIVTFLGFFVAYYNKQQQLVELSNKLYNFQLTQQKDIKKQSSEKSSASKYKSIQRDEQTNNQACSTFPQNKKIGVGDEHQPQVILLPPESNKSKQSSQPPESQDRQINFTNRGISIQINKFGQKEGEKKSTFLQKQEQIINKYGYKTRKEYLSTQLKEIVTRKKNIEFSFKYFLNTIFCSKCCPDKDCQLLDKAVQITFQYKFGYSNRVNNELDIFVMLEKLDEIDKLKQILLNKQQIVMFNFTPKPIISLQEAKTIPTRFQIQKSMTLKSNSQTNKSSKQQSIASIAMQAKDQQDSKLSYIEDVKAYYKLYKAYDFITNIIEEGELNLNEQRINQSLIKLLGGEVKGIFEASRHIFGTETRKDQVKTLIQKKFGKDMIRNVKRNQMLILIRWKKIQRMRMIQTYLAWRGYQKNRTRSFREKQGTFLIGDEIQQQKSL